MSKLALVFGKVLTPTGAEAVARVGILNPYGAEVVEFGNAGNAAAAFVVTVTLGMAPPVHASIVLGRTVPKEGAPT
jgi:hypothetical protein